MEDYTFDGIELVPPTTVFDGRVGDAIVHVPKERVVFAGDVLFRQCTPVGWTGTYEKWFQ